MSSQSPFDPGKDPPDFQRYQRRDPDVDRSGPQFLLPLALRNELVAEDQRRRAEEEAKESATALARRNTAVGNPPVPTQSTFTRTLRVEDLPREEETWRQITLKDESVRSRLSHPVFHPEQALELFKSLGKGDKDDKERLGRIYTQLVGRGSSRRQVARPKSLRPLEELGATQPHMAPVVEAVIAQLVLAKRARKPLRLAPMLLVGDPGVGKTHFAQCLARALATTISIQRLDADLTGAFLLGSDRKWSNSRHGLLFELVVTGEYANPVIVLDELDKSPRHSTGTSPLGCLYSALEPISATCVRDISLMFEFDASLVTWIATANNPSLLDAPLRSRFREFHIQMPTAAQCLVLAEGVMRAAVRALDIRGFCLDASLRRHVAHLPARQIYQLTQEAVALATAAGRKSLQANDFPRWVMDDATPRKNTLH